MAPKELLVALAAPTRAGRSTIPDLPERSASLTYVPMTREEMDAKLQATEARIDSTLSQLRADLAAPIATIKHLPSTWTIVTAVASSTAVTTGLIVGILAFGGDRFDGGVQVSSASVQTAIEAANIGKQNSEQIRALADRADQFQAQWASEVNRLIDAINAREPIAPTKP